MSIDTTFKPAAPTTLVGVTATQIGAPGVAAYQGGGITTFRVHNILATAQVLGWGQTAATAVATAATAGSPANALTIGAGGVLYLELPAATFFIANIAAAFEITGGIGGTGGAG